MGKVLQRALVPLLVFSLLFSLVPSPSAAAGPDWRKIDPALKDMMIRDARGNWPIIVEAEARVLPEADQRGQAERAGRAAQRLRAHAGRERFSLPIIGAVGGVAGYDTITALSNDPAVAFIYYDAPLRALETPTPVHIYEDVVKAPAAWDAGYTGRGVGIAVLDSGVLPTADLTVPRNRVVARVDLVGDGAGSLDPGGHGTHVAGIIAGNGYDSRDNAAGAFRGIAPEAQIVDVRVIDGKGASNLSTVIRGIQWVLQNKRAYNIRIINLSLGRPVGDGYTYRSDPLVAALEIAWFAGIVVVVPAGNGGPDGGTINSPGTGPLFLTVGALDDAGTVEAGDDVVPSFSGRGPTPDGIAKPDLVAPGRRIISLRSPGSYLDQAHPERVVTTSTGSTYFRLTGTSMAAPVVSGVAALLLEKNPRLLSLLAPPRGYRPRTRTRSEPGWSTPRPP